MRIRWHITLKVQAQFHSRVPVFHLRWISSLSILPLLCFQAISSCRQLTPVAARLLPCPQTYTFNGYSFCALLCDGHSHVATRGDTGGSEKQSSWYSREVSRGGVTTGHLGSQGKCQFSVRFQETGVESQGWSLYWGFCRKGKAGQSKQPTTGWSESFPWAWGCRGGPCCPAWDGLGSGILPPWVCRAHRGGVALG